MGDRQGDEQQNAAARERERAPVPAGELDRRLYPDHGASF
jgi:hypothetical protein